ncbi:U-box domain-containing protein 29-like [Vigna radiata var. radiata]|uniref:U-box domain-containing protein n=1 Tax=Vigna radiata var. radiata TaxID=3916 RepID=A0A1S3UBM3_VIGRR|nr:U-box domain-containing protein 29-like [Vigna radiata var. radiata]
MNQRWSSLGKPMNLHRQKSIVPLSHRYRFHIINPHVFLKIEVRDLEILASLQDVVVPNRTLQRLIQIWSDSLHHPLHSTHSPTSTHSQSLPFKDQILLAISDLQTRANNRFDSLAKIARFAQDSKKNRDFLLKTECFVPLLVGFLHNVNGVVEFLEQVVMALDLVIGKMEDCEELKNLILKAQGEAEKQSLDSLLVALRQGNHAAQTDLIENCLLCLVAISFPRRSKMKLVCLGVVKVLSKLLCASNITCMQICSRYNTKMEQSVVVGDGHGNFGGF